EDREEGGEHSGRTRFSSGGEGEDKAHLPPPLRPIPGGRSREPPVPDPPSMPLLSSEELSRRKGSHLFVSRVADELVGGFEALRDLGPAVSIFGSARAPRGSRPYRLGVRLAELLARRGFAIVTGGGPGVMEAANRGAKRGGGVSVGLNIDL